MNNYLYVNGIVKKAAVPPLLLSLILPELVVIPNRHWVVRNLKLEVPVTVFSLLLEKIRNRSL